MQLLLPMNAAAAEVRYATLYVIDFNYLYHFHEVNFKLQVTITTKLHSIHEIDGILQLRKMKTNSQASFGFLISNLIKVHRRIVSICPVYAM